MNLALLLLQIGVILSASRVLGFIFRKIHQPQVIGEMVAGILLGPSLLGWVAPTLSAALFPSASLDLLNALSQIGLLLFMFLVGLELDPGLLRKQGHAATVTSHASILAPFFLGTVLALFLYPRFSDNSVSFANFALFMGVSMSITAFPVLARILTDRGLLRTPLGSVAIACAAVDDVTGWCILAAVVALARASTSAVPVWLTFLGSIAYVGALLSVGRWALRWVERTYLKQRKFTGDVLAIVLLFVLASGWVTETLGIHALFGAFAIGVIMPKHRGLVREITEKLEGPVTVLLLPLFFAFTGLRTSIVLLNSPLLWFFCGLIVFVAILGKFGGSAIAARLSGMTWREAGAIGILMNTRGLIELVLLNIGLDIGVLSPALFSMMVVMALVTTFMTTPILEWFYLARAVPQNAAMAPNDEAPQEAHE